MRRALLMLAMCSVWAADGAAQELTPRTYWPAPKGIKVAVLGYVYAKGDVLFDPSIPLYGVNSEVNRVVAAYLQTFGLWGRTANILVELPYQWSTTWGILVDTAAKGSVPGFGDLGVTLVVNLLGAPTMTPGHFQALRAKPQLIIGGSLKVVAPTGKYDGNPLLNVGCNPPFRELCDDYRRCVVALERWKEEDWGHAAPWQEYTELLGELRGEIQSWLEAMEEGSYRTNGEAR